MIQIDEQGNQELFLTMQGKKRYLEDPRYDEIEKLKKGGGLTFDLGSSEEEEMRSEEQWDLVFLAVGLRI